MNAQIEFIENGFVVRIYDNTGTYYNGKAWYSDTIEGTVDVLKVAIEARRDAANVV